MLAPTPSSGVATESGSSYLTGAMSTIPPQYSLGFDMTNQPEKRSFKCLRCGTCCRWPGHVLLTDQDITRIAEAIGLSEDAFIEKYTELAANRRQLTLKDIDGHDCIFLKNDGCEIYAARPDQCRNFPYTWQVSSGCPALDALDKTSLKR
jgi:Fe-S-cluster containining protein